MTDMPRKLSREEIAVKEVGQTKISRLQASVLSGVFVLIICVVPLVDQLYDALTDEAGPRRPAAAEITRVFPDGAFVRKRFRDQGLWGGALSINGRLLEGLDRYENTLKDRSALSNALIPPMQRIVVGGFRAGTETVYCGVQQWLFYRPAVDSLTSKGFLAPEVLAARARLGNETTAPPQPHPSKAILEFHDFLSSCGIQLVVLPIPSKATVYPEYFSSHYTGTYPVQNASFAPWLTTLQDAGVCVHDPAPALTAAKTTAKEPLYLKRDTHWSPSGVDVVIADLVQRLREDGFVFTANPRDYRRESQQVTHKGDIAAMLKYGGCSGYVQSETVCVNRVVDQQTGQPWRPEASAEILVLGDSFTNIFSLEGMGWGSAGGFAAQLAAALQQPVDAIVRNDNGAHATRAELMRALSGNQERLKNKRLVVWEFAARELCLGDWKTGLTPKQAFAATEAKAEKEDDNSMQVAETPSFSNTGRLRIRATITAKTPPPLPDDIAPYTENLTVFEYQVDEVLFGSCDLTLLYVAHWGVREGKSLVATVNAQVGDTLDLDLEHFAAHPELEGINIADTVVSDFSLPLLFEVAGLANTATEASTPSVPLHLARTRRAPASEPPPAEQDFMNTSEEKIQARKASIDRELAAATDKIESAGGLAAWWRSQTDFRRSAQILLREKTPEYFWGDDGFLFVRNIDLPYCLDPSLGFAPEVQAATQAQQHSPFDVVVNLNQQLQRRGIDLIVVPIPPRAEVDPEIMLQDENWADWMHPGRMHFLRQLLQADVEVLDVLSALRDLKRQGLAASLKMESHFSPKAAEAVARQIADKLLRYAFVADESYKTPTMQEETTLTMRGVYAGRYREQLGADHVETLPARRILKENGDPVGYDAESPVLLIGDSYVGVFDKYNADIGSQLVAETGVAIDGQYSAGGGAKVPRELYAMSSERLRKKKVVVWMFVARYLIGQDAIRREWTFPEKFCEITEQEGRQESHYSTSNAGQSHFTFQEMKSRSFCIEEESKRIQSILQKKITPNKTTECLTLFESTLNQYGISNTPDIFMSPAGYIFSRSWDIRYLLDKKNAPLDPELVNNGVRTPLTVILQVDRYLKNRNIHLIVLPVPPRSEASPELLQLNEETCDCLRYGHWHRLKIMHELLQNDVEVVDVLPAFQELKSQGIEVSLRTDSHYTPAAARAAAIETAKRIQRYDFATKSDFHVAYSVEEAAVAHTGNLSQRWAEQNNLPLPADENVPIARILGPDGKPTTNDKLSPVLIVGDSYGYSFQKHASDYRSHLAEQLSMPVVMKTEGAGGPRAPRVLAALPQETLGQFRVVVWIFAARYLNPPPPFNEQWISFDLK